MFKKAAVFGDLHLGKRSDSLVHNQDCINFIEWFCSVAKKEKVDKIIFIGDWFDNQSRIRTDTNHFSNKAMRMLLKVAPVHMLTGNHDMFNRENRTVTSIDHFSNWEGITVYNEHTLVDGVGMIPYLVGSEYLNVIGMKAKYMFGHFSFPRFLMNGSTEMRDSGQFNSDQVTNCDYVFSGHFHKRQLKLNKSKIPVWYIGNPFGHTFNDVNDTERGMMIMEWDGEPKFIDWEEGPLYQRFTTSEILDLLETGHISDIVRKTSVLEIKDDIGLELEDISLVREELSELVREARVYEKSSSITDIAADVEDMDGKTMDEVVIDHLGKIDPRETDIDVDLLINLFKNAS